MRRVLADSLKKARFALISLIAHLVDVLLSRIQLLNARKGALKHFVASKRSPLRDARRALCINLTRGQNEGRVGTLFRRYGSSDVHINFAGKIVAGLDAQLWWRFRGFFEWPMLFAKIADLSGDGLLDLLKPLFGLFQCCLVFFL